MKFEQTIRAAIISKSINMHASSSTPLILATIAWLFLIAVASLCPTYSYIHIFFHLCGTPSGHIFSVAFLAWIFHDCRLIWRLVSFCINTKRRWRNVKYSPLTSANTYSDDEAEKQSLSTLEEQCKQSGKNEQSISTTSLRWIALDLAASVILYFGLCLFAYIFWSPPTFDLDNILSNGAEDGDDAMLTFPPNFTFGASTSAYQVEGYNFNNQWSKFENETGIERCGAAADMWNTFESDIHNLILAENGGLHLDALRLSVEWSRIEPQQGVFDEAALDKYASWIALLHENEIEPIVTLHHFTNPIWFEDLGGFENDTAPLLVAPFVRKVAERLGPQGVDRWITINEIMVYAGNGYLMGEFPPGRSGELGTMLKVVRNMLLCHESMYNAIKETNKDASVSIAKNTILYHPKSYFDLISIVTAAISDVYYNEMPIRVLKQQGTIDYLGINTYIRMKVAKFGSFMGFINPPDEQSDMGWDLESQVLYQTVKQYNSYLPELDIIITEHGVADGNMPDVRRKRFVKESLIGLAVAINDERVPVRGYLHWSLVDNFEWSSGFAPHFGLYHINLPNDQKRTITEGGELYRDIIDMHQIPL